MDALKKKFVVTNKETGKQEIIEAVDKKDLLENWDISEEYFYIDLMEE